MESEDDLGYGFRMAALSIDLPDTLEAFVAQQVATGEYASPQEVVLAGLQGLHAQEQAEAVKMERFLALVQEGIDEIDRGEGIVVADLTAFFDDIMADIETEFANRAA